MWLQHIEPLARDEEEILTDAAAVGNAAGRVFNWRVNDIPGWTYYPGFAPFA